METRHYWEENGHAVKYESYNTTEEFRNSEHLGFAVPSEDEDYQAGFLKKGKVARQDPMSHRIIEKRRRDRMNNCLADLSRLIPPEYLKKGRGRVEKTEIIEMAIRHLKFLQERANAAERAAGEEFRAGFQEALAEAARFLVEVQGHGPADGLCVKLASHLQRHMEMITKGEAPREKRHPTSSSDTASSSSSSHSHVPREGVIARRLEPPQPETYDQPQQYPMECDRVASVVPTPEEPPPEGEPMALDGRRKREPTLRAIRKPEHGEDFLHSYKFKNSIERRFSRSQDCEATDMTVRGAPHKNYGHKRRRATKPAPSTTSTSNSGSTEDAQDTSPQDTSSESPHHHYEKPLAPPAQYVPVFALNSLGKYYVPLSVDYSCLSRHLGPYDVLDARAAHLAAPLHPVTIHVNFQPCLNYHVKREPHERDWRPV
ncbi:transcription factor cwo isoform X3 [Leguminivora glycinivorella]|uniref:transcription factor cwo isoform X3 n=1 Tax=Leguminivora glycinivorella TaxID=1035111 RepID=UPI00200DDE52|nr:transcription factor cwo isoform X3 [Leguminivora glycinivorella]